MGAMSSCASRRRILVVDDVELNRTLTEAVLRGATYEVDTVEDGAAALAAVDGKRYDLVLLDLEMPGLHGHSAAAAIRRQDSVVRVAALSSHCETEDRRRSAEIGMNAHIGRPIAPRALLEEIERVFCQQIERRADPWERRLYEDWAARLGAERMRGVLLSLREQFETLSELAAAGGGEALHRLAHDCASTSGMLGFLEVTRRCRTLLEGSEDDQIAARDALQIALDDAVGRLDDHFSSERRGAA